MSTDIAQFLWVEGRLSVLERLCLASFLANGYEVHLYSYSAVDGVPTGVTQLDGREILPVSYVTQHPGVSGRSYASFSDLFRYELLRRKGGWWFDMDMICVRHLPPPSDFLVASTWEGKYGQCAVNSALWCPVNHAAMVEASSRAHHLYQSGDISFGSMGPFLMQQLIIDFNLQDSVSPWWEFCPYPWRLVHRLSHRSAALYLKDVLRGVKHRAWELIDPGFKAGYVRRGSRTLHCHNEIWKSSGLSKDHSYFYLSPIESYKRRYLAA